jgi:TetR/AcrR family transcriptional repressor of mexJK operon
MSQEENIKEKELVITEAARKRFAHYGFSKVTMDEIATDVEMGKASLYYYFPTKEELFRAVLAQEMNELKKNIEIILQESETATTKLHQYVEQRMNFFQILLNLGTLSVHSYFDPKSIFKKLFIDLEEVELGLLRKIFDEGKKNKEFDKKLNNDTAVVFLHIIQGLRCRVLKHSKGQGIDEAARNDLQKEMNLATEIFINGIKKR